jgi:hypothetical protein
VARQAVMISIMQIALRIKKGFGTSPARLGCGALQLVLGQISWTKNYPTAPPAGQQVSAKTHHAEPKL